jgi:hypothetical protein
LENEVFMRRAICAVILIVLAIAASYQVPVYAQEGQSLQGKIILFGVSNGEADPFDRGDNGASRLGGLLERDGATIRTVNWGLPLPLNADLIVLIGARVDYSGAQIARLWTYLEQGGSLLLLADPPGEYADRVLFANSGLFELLFSDYGLGMSDAVLVNPVDGVLPTSLDAPPPVPLAGAAPVQVISSLFSNNPQHPILIDVDTNNIALNFARPLTLEAVLESASVTSLLYSTDRVYAESAITDFAQLGVYSYNDREDTAQMPYLVAGVSQNPVTGTRIGLIGDGDTGRNSFGFASSPPGSEAFVFPNTVRFMLNTIYWLVDLNPAQVIFTSAAPIPTATPTLIPTPTPTLPG